MSSTNVKPFTFPSKPLLGTINSILKEFNIRIACNWSGNLQVSKYVCISHLSAGSIKSYVYVKQNRGANLSLRYTITNRSRIGKRETKNFLSVKNDLVSAIREGVC